MATEAVQTQLASAELPVREVLHWRRSVSGGGGLRGGVTKPSACYSRTLESGL